jgi:hypothetical protein
MLGNSLKYLKRLIHNRKQEGKVLELSLDNLVEDSMKGVQLGIRNRAHRLKGAQFGIVNQSGRVNKDKANTGSAYGIQIGGASVSIGEMSGLQANLAVSGADDYTGLQFSLLFGGADKLTGVTVEGLASTCEKLEKALQISGLFSCAEDVEYGVQVTGALNIAERVSGTLVQVGLGNLLDQNESCEGYSAQIASTFNYSRYSRGAQAGAINVTERLDGLQVGALNAISNYDQGETESSGLQVGAVNVAPSRRKFDGWQFGLICYADKGNYNQVGLLTIRSDGPWYSRISPFFGFHRS